VIDLLESYGPPELSGWRVEQNSNGKDVFWIQTTWRPFARKLKKRKDTRQVEMTGFNHFRETFELRGTSRKIKRIIDHYISSAGDQFSALNRPSMAPRTEAGHFMSGITKRSCRSQVTHSSHSTRAPRRRGRVQLERTSTP